jgi:hypothetical protein
LTADQPSRMLTIHGVGGILAGPNLPLPLDG